MNNFAKYLLCAIFFLIVCSCSSDSDSPAPKEPPIINKQFRIVSIDLDGGDWKTFFYNEDGSLGSYRLYTGPTTFYESRYFYKANGQIDSVREFLDGVQLSRIIDYTYADASKIEKIEYYGANHVILNTATYTYTGNQLTNIDNSDKSLEGLHFRNFEYNSENNVSLISFDHGNSYMFTYYSDVQFQTPLLFDLSDPINLTNRLIHTFTYVPYSSYTATYEFDSNGLVTTETRNYPERPIGDSSLSRQEVYTYTYSEF